jgi:hypothetical protein
MNNFDLRKYLAENKLTQEELNEENLEEGWKEWVAGGLLALTTLVGIGKAYAPKMDQLDSGDEIELAQNAYADAFKKMSDEDVDDVYTQVYKSDIKDDLKQNKFAFTSDTDKETRDAAWPDMQRASLENAVAKHLDRFVISPDGTVTFVSNPGGFQAIKEEEKPSTKMKKSKLKEMIKTAFLSEADFTNAQDDDAALGGMYDPVYEAEEEESSDEILARIMGTSVDPYMAEDLNEQEDEEETDIDVDAEEETEGGKEKASDSIVIDKKIVSLSSLPQQTRKILDTLETLRAQAEEFGDQKFITQVGNTITFFTRDFVVAGDEPTRAKVDESLNEDLSTGLVILLSAASVVGAIKGHIAAVGGVDDFTPIKDLKAWWQERKSDKALKSIINKIKDDEDIVKFMKLPPAQQRGKFRSLIATKLSDTELDYLNKINRSHFQKESVNEGKDDKRSSMNESVTFPMWNKIK